jgi:preprotein translocase subunit SecE
VLKRMRRYFQESWSELKKVSWPTRTQVRNLTVLVFAVSAAVGAFIAVWDFVFTEVIRFITPAAG